MRGGSMIEVRRADARDEQEERQTIECTEFTRRDHDAAARVKGWEAAGFLTSWDLAVGL
jgi:hypothetical protein